jgi:hypothetical protein
VGFLRRRLPYVLEVWGAPFRTAAFFLRRPLLWWQFRAYRRALRDGDGILGA